MAFLIDVLMHTGFFVIAIPIFYFEFVVKSVNYALADQLSTIIKTQILKERLTIFNRSQIQTLFNEINKLISPRIEAAQKSLSSRNDVIYNYTYALCTSIAGGCIFTAFLISLMYSEDFMDIIYSNIIVIGFILISEFIIVYFFLDKLQIIDFDFLRATFIKAIESPSYDDCGYILEFARTILPQSIINLYLNN
jgi:hypothetical protein